MVIQIVVSLFIVFVVLRSLIKYLKKLISLRLFIFWLIFWGLVGLLFWMPTLSQEVANLLQVGRGVDAITYISLVVLFYLMFKIFNHFERQEREMTKLVRKIAIQDASKNNDNETS